MIVDPESYANEYELDAKFDIDSKKESGSVPIVAMRLWLRAAHAVVELTGPADDDGKTFGSDGNVFLWLHESDLELGNILLNRISKENAKLREQMERLVALLRVDCDIDASWDGLRRFWSIELTDDGCLMRDRACKAEAENAKLREQIHWLKKGDILHVLTDQEYIDQCERERLMQVSIDALDKENAKLRERLRSVVNKYCNSGTCDGCPILGKDESCPY